jgi:phenylacetate-CoA ligase
MCPEKNGLHLAEDNILLEVLDPKTQEPVPDGQPGEMVLTTLLKQARPMIRFRTGDIITRLPDACPCGRTFSRFVVQGRLDDMFIVSGVNVFPSDIEFVVRNVSNLTGEYRIVVYTEDRLTRFDIEVEAANSPEIFGDQLAAEVIQQAKQRLGIRPKNVKVLPPGTLPRATHKAKRVIDQRNADGALKGANI